MFKNQHCRHLATGLENYTNTDAPDSDYPAGKIRDNPGDNTGTPFNTEVYGDVHQFLAKLLRMADITANGLPENEYSGHQYIQALRRTLRFNGLHIITGGIVSTLVDTSLNKLIVYDSGAGNGHNLSLEVGYDERELPSIRVTNNSPYTVNVFDVNGDDINDVDTGFALVSGRSAEFIFDRTNVNWISC